MNKYLIFIRLQQPSVNMSMQRNKYDEVNSILTEIKLF